MTAFRLPDQVPVAWAQISQSGEAGTNAMHIAGSGLEIRNYLMHVELLPVPASISLHTRLRARLVGMTVSNPAFEGAAVKHRGFKITGSEPNLDIDTQVWDSNPDAGGTAAWISGDTGTEFNDYSFLVSPPNNLNIDYVTWELVVRSPGQIIVDGASCKHYYGTLIPMNIIGYQRIEKQGFQLEYLVPDFNGSPLYRYVTYLQTESINARVGQVLVFDASGAIDGVGTISTIDQPITAPSECLRGVMAKMRRTNTSTYDYITVFENYTTGDPYRPVVFEDTRQRRCRYDYDQVELLGFIDNITTSTTLVESVLFISFQDLNVDMMITDFVGPSQ